LSLPPSVRQAANGYLFFRCVFRGSILDHRQDHAVVGSIPIRRDAPVLAVPGLDATGACTLVVGARHLDGLEHAFEAELVEAIGTQVEIFQAPAHLLARKRLLAKLDLRGPDALDAEHGVDQASHIEDFTRLLPFGGALT